MVESEILLSVEVRVKKDIYENVNSNGTSFRRFIFNPVCPICLRENHITLDSISLFGPLSEEEEGELDFKLHPAYKACRHYLYHFCETTPHPGEDYIFCKTTFIDI